MKITIYELLGLVKDGKLSKMIKYNFQLEFEKFYVETLFELLRDSDVTLYDEVEILDDEDEEKELPEKLYHCCMESENEEIKFLIQNINDLADKYNDLLDYLEKQRKGE